MTKAAKILSFFLLFSSITIAQSQPVQNHSWLKRGAYARYTSSTAPAGSIFFPNGTKIKYETLESPSFFQWKIVKIKEEIAVLNLTFSIKGNANILKPDNTFSSAKIAYYKAMLLDVNIQTGEAFISGESIGRISFWAETNVVIGQKIELFSFPSDHIEGVVTRLKLMSLIGRRVSSYEVEVLELNPFAFANYVFDQQTGIAVVYTLLGTIEVMPNSTHTYTFPNGTTYDITSYAKTELSDKLGLEYTYVLKLDDTNVEFGRNIQPVVAPIYVAIFISLLVSLAAVFVFVDRRRAHS